MQLVTKQFGGIDFEAADVLVFESGICEFVFDRQWLLVADQANEDLYWLQSISNTQVALPVLAAEGLPFEYELATKKEALKLDPRQLVVLLPIEESDGELTVALHLPIVVDSERGLGLQLRNERYQSAQRLTSARPTLLRQSA